MKAGEFDYDDMRWLFGDVDAGAADPAEAPKSS